MQGLLTPGGVKIDCTGEQAFSAIDGSSGVEGLGPIGFRDEDLAAVQAELGSGPALAHAWRRYQFDLPRALKGRFVIVCWSDDGANALLAADAFGTIPVYWQSDGKRIAFASKPVDVSPLLGHGAALDPDAVRAYVYFHSIPAPMSICADVQRLDLGHAVKVRNGAASLERYWQPPFEESNHFDFETEKAEFFAAVEEGIGEGVKGLSPEDVGCFLSGGTDSSTIAGLLSRRTAGQTKTFSITFGESQYDESEYSRLASRHFGTDHHEHQLRPDEAIRAISVISRTFEQPFGNSSAIPTYVCASTASEHGIKRLLGGDGGDELYGGNSRYATAWLLGLYQRLPALFRRGLLEPLAKSSLTEGSFWPARKFRGYVTQAIVPMPDQIHGRYNLLNAIGIDRVFSPGFLGAMSGATPTALEEQVWQRSSGASDLNRLLAYDFKFTLSDNDLPKVTQMCHAAGLGVEFPLLWDRVVKHSLRTPSNQKLRRTELRHFYRKSLRGFLPDKIIDKPKHGFGMPFGEWLVNQPELKAMSVDALLSLEHRRIVRTGFSKDIDRMVQSGSPGYYGTIVWVLMALELWLRESPFADCRWD